MDEGTTVTLASPALDHIIERPRLISLLEEAGARVILLAAPAGYGKTTLARQWSARQTGPVAWYRTTRASGDVAALAVGLDTVLAAATEPRDRDPKRIGSIASVNANPAPLARALVSTYAHLTQDVLLVLDEWEAAGTEEAEELLAPLVAELGIRFLVTTRARPPWFTPRLVVYGDGAEVGIDQLAMTEEEALNVLTSKPSAEEVELVVQTAQGWPAVLGLAALTKVTDLHRSGGVSRALYEYFAEELLSAASSDVQEGLALLAIGGISDVPTARLVLGKTWKHTLEDATTGGLLTVHQDGAMSIHPLLRELMINRTHVASAPVDRLLPSLRTLIAAGRWDEALAVAETLPEPDFVTSALQEGLTDLLRLRGVDTLRRWVSVGRLSGADHALVTYLEGELALRDGDLDRALMLTSGAARTLDGDLGARAHLVCARAAYLGDRPGFCDEHITVAQELAHTPDTSRTVRWLKFARALEDERDDALSVLDESEAASDGTVDATLRIAQGWIHLGFLEGSLPAQLDRAAAAAALLGQQADPMVLTSFLNLYSNALSACARYGAALDTAAHEATLAEEYGLGFVKRHALVNRAKALIGLRRFGLAQRTLSELDRSLRSEPDEYVRSQHAVQTASLYLSIGDVGRAHAALVLNPSRTSKAFRGEYIATRALVLAASSRASDAVSCSAAAADISRSTEVKALISVCDALVALEGDDFGRACTAVNDAIDTGILHALLLGIRATPALGAYLTSDPRHSAILTHLLLGANDAAIARRLGLVVPRSTLRSQTLSPRELEIHGLIAQGMTNKEISRLLFISESTAKVHVRHILEKLGVRSRVEAARVWEDPAASD